MRCEVWLFALFIGLEWTDVVSYARDLVRRNGVDDQYERGAFLIVDSNGVSMIDWPYQRSYRAANWRGPIPEGAAAVLHTHPNEYPHPSSLDRAEARRIGLPVYVATRTRVCVVTPANEISCVSAKAGTELRRIPTAADQRIGSVAQMNPKR